MKRTKPLRRTPIKRKPSRRSQRTDRDLLAWLHDPNRFCSAYYVAAHRCTTPMEAAHMKPSGYGVKGIGTKTPDDCQVPMCREFHQMWDQRTGWFRGWSETGRQAWADYWIAQTRAAYAASRAGGVR